MLMQGLQESLLFLLAWLVSIGSLQTIFTASHFVFLTLSQACLGERFLIAQLIGEGQFVAASLASVAHAVSHAVWNPSMSSCPACLQPRRVGARVMCGILLHAESTMCYGRSSSDQANQIARNLKVRNAPYM